VLLGDYHALPNSQRYLASLLRDPALHRRPGRGGSGNDLFPRSAHPRRMVAREIDEAELRERIRFDLDWGYDWAPFSELLNAARDNSAPIYGLDCMPREDLRRIGARDRHAADKIADIRRRHPDALILSLWRIAPRPAPSPRVGCRALASSAPQAIVAIDWSLTRKRCGRNGSSRTALLTVLQNVDALYWRAAGEASDRVEAVEIGPDTFCVFNATPLGKVRELPALARPLASRR
jgi:hypothetical protein